MKVKEEREQKGQIEIMMISLLSTANKKNQLHAHYWSSQTHRTPRHTHAPTPT